MNETKNILEELKLPFHPSAIDFRPGATNAKKDAALGLFYGDLRAYQNRLDEVCGLDWSVTYSPWGERIICHLTIAGVTRSSTGESEAREEKSEIGGTSAEAQAFKRACAMFSLGRYLYELPAVWAEFDGKAFTAQGKAKLEGVLVAHYRRAVLTPAGQGGKPEDKSEQPTKPPPPVVHRGPSDPSPTDAELEAILPAPTPITDAQRRTAHSLGMALYGTKDLWEQERHMQVAELRGGNPTSASDLTSQEADVWIVRLEELAMGECVRLLGNLSLSRDAERTIITAATGKATPLGELYGVGLSKVLAELVKAQAVNA